MLVLKVPEIEIPTAQEVSSNDLTPVIGEGTIRPDLVRGISNEMGRISLFRKQHTKYDNIQGTDARLGSAHARNYRECTG